MVSRLLEPKRSRRLARIFASTVLCLILTELALAAVGEPSQTAIRDIATIAGVRENPLVGYGIVTAPKDSCSITTIARRSIATNHW